MKDHSIIQVEGIEGRIYDIRGQRVMLDSDLAELYGVPTWRLNEQVKRNRERFPEDFMFELTSEEWQSLRSQNAISKVRRGGRRYAPNVFTEHGAIMAASVLNSPTAVNVSILIVRAFVRLREMALTRKDFEKRLEELERRFLDHDVQFHVVFQALQELMKPKSPERRKKIGFRTDEEGK